MTLTMFSRKAQRFINSAREDSRDGKTGGLKLQHWTRVPTQNGKESPSSNKGNEDDEEMQSASGELIVVFRVPVDDIHSSIGQRYRRQE
jgi:hypothetical protein